METEIKNNPFLSEYFVKRFEEVREMVKECCDKNTARNHISDLVKELLQGTALCPIFVRRLENYMNTYIKKIDVGF
jgi:hypothetical protein